MRSYIPSSSAAVCGNIFASPNASQISRGIDLVDNKNGSVDQLCLLNSTTRVSFYSSILIIVKSVILNVRMHSVTNLIEQELHRRRPQLRLGQRTIRLPSP